MLVVCLNLAHVEEEHKRTLRCPEKNQQVGLRERWPSSSSDVEATAVPRLSGLVSRQGGHGLAEVTEEEHAGAAETCVRGRQTPPSRRTLVSGPGSRTSPGAAYLTSRRCLPHLQALSTSPPGAAYLS